MVPKKFVKSLPIFIFLLVVFRAGLSWGFTLPAAILPGTGSAENQAEKPAQPEKDSLGRETPRSSFENFVKAAATRNFNKASQYLQALPGKSREQIEELITHFKILLDRGYLGAMDSISNEPLGNLADGLDPDEDSAGDIKVGDKKLDIIMVRIKTQGGRELWFISKVTLNEVPTFYKNLKASKLESKLPDFLVRHHIANAPLYIWLMALLFIPLLWGVSWLLVHGFIYLTRLGKKIFGRSLGPYPYKSARPVIILFTLWFHFMAVTTMGLPILLRHYYGRMISVLVWMGFGWLLFRWIDSLARRYLVHLEKQGSLNAHNLMLLVRKLLKVAVLALIGLVILKILGFNVNTALAGLGIGGIALALAAQKTIENLFGGVSLISDQVMRVGEFCKIGDRVGTVEDISLRSTRLRTLDRTLLYVPNGSLSVENLENYSRRDKFWFHHFLGLRYETKSGQIRKILQDIQKLFEAHELVESSTSWVKFVRMGAYSLDLELFAYLTIQTYSEFLAVSEELLLQCMEIVEAAGSSFAFPSQTTYLAQDSLPGPKPNSPTS